MIKISKISKRRWEINNIQKLSELTENPKLFWSHLRSLRGTIKSSIPNATHHYNGLDTFQNCYILKMKGEITKNFFYIMILIEI